MSLSSCLVRRDAQVQLSELRSSLKIPHVWKVGWVRHAQAGRAQNWAQHPTKGLRNCAGTLAIRLRQRRVIWSALADDFRTLLIPQDSGRLWFTDDGIAASGISA